MSDSDFVKLAIQLEKSHHQLMNTLLPKSAKTHFKNAEKEILQGVQSIVNNRMACNTNKNQDSKDKAKKTRSISITED